MALTYPVDLTAKYAFLNAATGDLVLRKDMSGPLVTKWPREDGMPLLRADTNIIPLLLVVHEELVIDPATHKLERSFIDVVDEEAQEFHVYFVAVPKSAEELAAAAQREANVAREQKLTDAIVTLRQWAQDAENATVTEQNALAIQQTMVGRVGKFFDHFADLIEARGGHEGP